MRIESKKYLYDIVHAAELALGFVAGKNFAAYEADPMLRSAVERQLEIVGEALAQLARIDLATASQIGNINGLLLSATFSSTAMPQSIIASFGTYWTLNCQSSYSRHPATCSTSNSSAEAVFQAARDLALVLKGVRGFDADFKGEVGNHESALSRQSSAIGKTTES